MPRKGDFTPNQYRIEGNFAYIALTQGEEAIIDVGDLPKVLKYRWYTLKPKKEHTYYVVSHNRTKQGILYLHRYIMDAPAGLEIDHWNHDGRDNRRKNLRVTDHSGNTSHLKGAPKDSILGVRGLSVPVAHHRKGGKYTYYVYRFRCQCKACPMYKEFPATAEGFQAAKAFAEKHFATM